MRRDLFFDMFKALVKSYGSKKVFEIDDYYDQVKYLHDSDIDRLRTKIIEGCEYLPKPAELKKLSQEFKLPFTKKEHSEIEFGNCQIITNGVPCNQPVYKSIVDPYRCKRHYEEQLRYLKDCNATVEAIDFYETGRCEIPETEQNKPLLLSRIKESLRSE